MTNLILTIPTKSHETAIMDFRQEHIDRGERRINGSCGLFHYVNFDEWLELVRQTEKAETSPMKLPATTYISVRESDSKVIGTIQLRHYLNEEFEVKGYGHIGFGIRPSERQKGYAKEQLLLVLDEARKLNITKVMLGCYADNIASSKTIIACGGVFSHEIVEEGRISKVYWIDISTPR